MGTKSQKKAKTRLDAYYRLAKDQGYRARSAFKLIQLNRKYDFLAKSRVLVDLCAAPGGWCQVAAKYMPIGSKIVGIDLVPIAPIKGCKTFVGDITDDKSRKIIVTYLKKEPVDCVVHDGAGNVGGVWSRDLFEQNSLVLSAAKMACAMLKPGGWFVTKVFRSQDFQKLMWVMKQLFDKVEATKPLASRMESAEIFVVCHGYKAPKHIDPKMFNAQAVFQDVAQEKIVNPAGGLSVPHSKVPMGYDDFATISHRTATLTEFLNCPDAKDFLRNHHEIRFPEEDRHFLKSKYSRKELVYLCHDLQQVGEADRRRLCRWREQLQREQKKLQKLDSGSDESGDEEDDAAEAGSGEELDDAAAMAKQLLDIRKRDAKEQKKKQKKIVDRKLKQVRGLINFDPTESSKHLVDEFAQGDDVVEEEGAVAPAAEQQEGDWSIANVEAVDEDRMASMMDKHYAEPDDRGHNTLQPVTSILLEDQEEYDLGEEGDEAEAASAGGINDDEGPDMVGNSLRVVEGQEEEYDVDYYGNYVPVKRSERVQIFDIAGEEGEGEEDEEDGDELSAIREKEMRKEKQREKDEEDLDGAGKQAKWQRRHMNITKVLNRTFPKPKDPASVTAARKKNIEEDRVDMRAEREGLPDIGSTMKRDQGTSRKRLRFEEGEADDSDDNDGGEYDSDVSSLGAAFSDDDEDIVVNKGRGDSRRKKDIVPDMGKLTTTEIVKQHRKEVIKNNRDIKKANRKAKRDDGGFEEIPIAMTDPDTRARTLAIATKMLDKRSRRDILDASINKYTNNDDDDLPDWFIKDEQRNCKVVLPITAAEIDTERQRFLEMSSRPGKKVAEALGRKRRKAQRMLRGIMEKGKSDPRAREKAGALSVRKLMRSQVVKGAKGGKKKQALDPKTRGEKKRETSKAKRIKSGRK